jgi:prepilin-type processing-associated H-X9-DG protein
MPANNGSGHSYVVCVGDQVLQVNGSNNTRGLFARFNHRRFADILDGTSNTAAFSEICSNLPTGAGPQQGHPPANAKQYEIKLACARGVLGLVNSPSICRTVSDGKYYVAGTIVHGRRGIKWTDAPAALMSFNTVLPPNSPACGEAGDFGDQDNMVIPPQSRHPGGVSIVLCDGSVRFISDTIDAGNLGVNQPATGPSNYGVWGALGSIAGGESNRLD